MTLLGTFALWATALISLWGAVVAFSGQWQDRPELRRSLTYSVYASLGLLLTAAFCLWQVLAAHDFNVEYVSAYTSRNLPPYFLISAFWAGQKGSLLLWALVLALFAALAQWLTARRHADLLPWVAGITSATLLFFVLVMIVSANPFGRLPFTPDDGQGLNPQLQHPAMIIHPPMLYLGYISATIPFAFAMAAMLTRRLDTGWIHAIRKWTLVSWLFLSIGITLGMWWAYVELGWGGYWGWDPVENASFLPWLTMTAFLHSVMIQEKRGMLKRWNLTLVVITFLLTIFGTFLTRSGVIASVHSFTQSPVGWWFLGYLIVAGIFAFTLLYTRWPELEPEAELESVVSRESAFLFNNLLLVGIAFSVLWGTLFPILSEAVQGVKITVGPPFFNKVNGPLGLMLLALTGIGPLIAWRKASTANLRRQFLAPGGTFLVTFVVLFALGIRQLAVLMCLALAAFVLGTVTQEFVRGTRARMRMYQEGWGEALANLIARNRRRYGGYLVHVGILIYFVAFAGAAFRIDRQVSLRPGESAEVKSPYGWTYRFTHIGVSQYQALNRIVSAASLEVSRDGKPLGRMVSEKRQHIDAFERPTFNPSTEVGLMTGVREDIYVVFESAVGATDQANYRFTINPLVGWVWIGGCILALGGLIAMWPGPTVGPKLPGASPAPQGGYAASLAGAGKGE
jgi:cytochrome c-type biogenesis protein CcmF